MLGIFFHSKQWTCNLQCDYPLSKDKEWKHKPLVSVLYLCVFQKTLSLCKVCFFTYSSSVLVHWLPAGNQQRGLGWDLGSWAFTWHGKYDLYTQLLTYQNKAAPRIFCEVRCRKLCLCSFRRDLLAASWAPPSSWHYLNAFLQSLFLLAM